MAAVNHLADRVFQVSTSDDDGLSSAAGLRIRISNEPELRLRMNELNVDGEEWRFLAYVQEDKGLLESSSQAGSYCKAAYLKAIRHNLAMVKKALQLEIDAEYKLIEDVVMATKEELSRLQRHPELFPSTDIREDFWRNVRLTCYSSVNSVIPGQETRDHVHKMFQADWMEIKEDLRTPRRDMQRKPWEKYLHNRAPGADADLSMFSEEGSLQIIPMAAARIIMANVEEYRAIIRDIEAQREDLRPYASSTGNYLHCDILKHSPDGHLRSYRAATDLLEPTMAGPIDIVRHWDRTNSLETLNLDFAALNRQRPPLRPPMWNFISLVVHDRPNYSADSNQRNETVEQVMNMFI